MNFYITVWKKYIYNLICILKGSDAYQILYIYLKVAIHLLYEIITNNSQEKIADYKWPYYTSRIAVKDVLLTALNII